MRTARFAGPLLFLLTALPASGQSGALTTSAQGFTFGDPSGVGLRSYSMLSSTLSAAHAFGPSFTAGTAVQVARASMSARGVTHVDVGGLSGAEVFASLRAGRIGLRGAFAPNLGRTQLTSDQLVVAGLAAAEILPFPVRHWGTGSRFGVDATLHLESAGYRIELLAAMRRHGWFTPVSDDPMRYRLGNQTRFGVRVSRSFSALRWVEVGGWLSVSGTDENLQQGVFDPGLRAMVHGATVLPVGQTSLLVRGSLYFRGEGTVLDLLEDPGVPADVLGGGSDARARTVVSVTLESRSSFGGVPLIVTAGARYGREVGNTLLGWGGLATEIELRPPVRGRWYLVPSARLHRGTVELVAPYGSNVFAWEAGLDLRWEAR